LSHQQTPALKTLTVADQPVPQPELLTQRLLLRPFREADAEAVQELLQCREIAANTRTFEYPYPEGAALAWIATHPEKWNQGASAIFAVCRQSEPQRPLGAIGLHVNPADENAELGYWIGQPWWGQGLCTEAAAAIVDFGFSFLGLKKIHAHHFVRNPASGRVLARIGMHQEGYLKGHIKKWGVFEDIVCYGLLDEQWRAAESVDADG
jgi:RimJ/RimL family protein N-acetyltransferase